MEEEEIEIKETEIPSVGINQLNRRLTILESGKNTTSRVAKSAFEMQQKRLQQIDEDILKKIKSEIDGEISDHKNFYKVVKKSIFYVDQYAGELSKILGFVLIGEIKFSICCELLFNIFVDLSLELIGSSVQSIHDAEFKVTKLPDETHEIKYISKDVEEHIIDTNKKKKKRTGLLDFIKKRMGL